MPDTPPQDPAATRSAANLLGSDPQAWLAAIVASSDDAIIGKTLDGVVRSWNQGATRIFGWTAEEMVGQSIYKLIPPARHSEEPAIIATLSRGERVDHYETVRLRKDGSHVDVSISVSPIRDASGRIIGAAKLARDITESKRLQRAEHDLIEELQQLASELEQQVEESQALQEELEQTNQELGRSLQAAEHARKQADDARHEAERANAAKSHFLATMSHELRTPLNAIAGYVDLLDAGLRGPLTAQQRQDLGRIKRSEETLLRLIEDVLNFAKLESGRLAYRYEDTRLDEILASIETFVTPRLVEKQLEYSFDPCGDAVVVNVDRDKLEQIMLNLVSNAVKFTDEGRIEVRCVTEPETIRIDVVDTGRGISRELLDTIFEPFVQGDHSLTRTAEGTGLGLSISRQLARAMGGDIVVRSAPGEGSTFTLTLPRRRAHSQ